jgi:hypothetical protein
MQTSLGPVDVDEAEQIRSRKMTKGEQGEVPIESGGLR